MNNQTTASLHLVCPHCHKTNRLPRQRLTDRPQCGQCGKPLFAGTPLELGAATFDTHLTRNDLPLVVDFWAPWCGPCKMMAPAFAEAATLLEPAARLIKVNTENEPGLAARFGIRSIPTLAVFRNGHEVARQAGAMDTQRLVHWVRSVI